MFSNRIKELRKEKGLTQVQLAEQLNVSKGTVAMWETGQRNPSFEMLDALCTFFDKRMDYIMGTSNDNSPVNPTESDIGLFQQYLALDDFGKEAVFSVINNEFKRCVTQKTTTLTKEDYNLSFTIK